VPLLFLKKAEFVYVDFRYDLRVNKSEVRPIPISQVLERLQKIYREQSDSPEKIKIPVLELSSV